MDDRTKQRLVEMSNGSLVEQDVLNIVEKIRDYDPNLRVKYCLPGSEEFGDAPYKITEICRDGEERKVMSIWKLDETVLERLYAADNARNNVLVDIENNNLLAQKVELRRYREEMDEAKDMLEHYLKSPKGRYSMIDPKTGNKITIDDQPGVPAKVERT